MTTVAVLPIKQLGNAKQRLSSLLDSGERAHLFTAMVEDVLTALEACSDVHRIVVVTDDPAVAELAGSFGAEIRREPQEAGLNQAVTVTGRQLAEEGVDTMVFLPGDIPLVSPEELSAVLEGFGAGPGAEFLIVPAEDLGGSNCVACSPPDCMAFAFGEDSFRKHLAIARDRGIEPQVLRLPGIGLDIDTPADLRQLVAATGQAQQGGREYSTVRFLTDSGLVARLSGECTETG